MQTTSRFDYLQASDITPQLVKLVNDSPDKDLTLSTLDAAKSRGKLDELLHKNPEEFYEQIRQLITVMSAADAPGLDFSKVKNLNVEDGFLSTDIEPFVMGSENPQACLELVDKAFGLGIKFDLINRSSEDSLRDLVFIAQAASIAKVQYLVEDSNDRSNPKKFDESLRAADLLKHFPGTGELREKVLHVNLTRIAEGRHIIQSKQLAEMIGSGADLADLKTK